MNESKSEEELSNTEKKQKKANEEDDFNIISFDEESESKSVLNLFGYELIAPKGMKNPLLIYGLFVIVNLTLFIVLKGFLK